MGSKSIDQPSRSSEVEHNPKQDFYLFLLERGGRQGPSPLASPADHQKLNKSKNKILFFWLRGVADRVRVHWPAQLIIRSWTYSKNEHFIFMVGEGWQTGFKPIDQPDRSSEVECNPKMSILFIWLGRGGRWGLSPSTSPADHSEVERNPKMSILFFLLETGGRWVILNLLTGLADHQKLNVIQKWAFYFSGWRGVANGVWVHQPT